MVDKAKKISLLLILSICLFANQLPASANTGTTKVAITFKESKTAPKEQPNDSDVVPIGEDIVYRRSGLGGSYSDGKRLPSTNDQYNLVLTRLGYLLILATFFFLIIGKGKGQEEREEKL